MTILVTGAAGFIGAHVAAALIQRGQAVLGIDDFNGYYDPALKRARLAALAPSMPVRPVDFSNPEALDAACADTDLEAIVHLGAQAGVRHSIEAPHDYVRSNLVGHVTMLELARARRIGHLVYASSSSVYGANVKTPFAVGDPVDQPVSLYAATKKADELLSESYAALYRLPQTGLRFFTVYGPWGRPDMAYWLFTEAILAGRPIRLFNNGAMRRDFTFIDDIVDGVLAALDRPPRDDGRPKPGGSSAPHALYNLGNDRAEPLARLVSLIETACERPAITEIAPMQPGDVTSTHADIRPARRDLGYAPVTTLDIGIPAFVSWFRARPV